MILIVKCDYIFLYVDRIGYDNIYKKISIFHILKIIFLSIKIILDNFIFILLRNKKWHNLNYSLLCVL